MIGADAASARRFYALLTSFGIGPEAAAAGAALADVPMLRTSAGWVPPARGQLPGGFVDPVGHFELIDTAPMDQPMQRLAREVLGVRVLTFKHYVEDHLEDILAAGPDRRQYVALLGEILAHTAELDADGGLQSLAGVAFVRTRAGQFARPNECHYWTSALEALLGEGFATWVDESWVPNGRDGARFRDLLEHRLGMSSSASMAQILARVREVAGKGTLDEAAERVARVMRHILDRWHRLLPDERRQLKGLRDIAFLPAAVGAERVRGKLYTPTGVYRAARAAGFSSQAPVVDLAPLRQSTTAATELLDLLAMPAEPPTEAVVAHLEHCMAAGTAASDVTYGMLNERIGAADAGCIDRLAGTAFIYAAELDRFLPAGRVFWVAPTFGGHWQAASPRMRLREPLYRHLGVADQPGPPHYAALLKEIAGRAHPGREDVAVHAQCLAWLAAALDRGEAGAEEAVGGLVGEYALLNLEGDPVWSDDAAWIDSQWLVSPFGDALDERLVAPPAVPRPVVERLFKRLGVRPVTGIARLRLADPPDGRPAPEATGRLRDRSDLLLWLAPTRGSAQASRR